MGESINKKSKKIKFYIVGYLIGYIYSIINNNFHILSVFPINALSIFSCIGLGGAFYYGSKGKEFPLYIPQVVMHVLAGIGAIIVISAALTIVHSITGIDVKPFLGT